MSDDDPAGGPNGRAGDGDGGSGPGDGTAPDPATASGPAFADGRRHEPLGEPEWPVRETALEYDTPWVTAGYDLIEHPDGSTKRYYWAELASAAVIVAVTEGEVLFVEQYRPTIRQTQLELPAGIVEADESFETAAGRELREETGFDPAGTTLIQEVWCSTGLLRHKRGYVFAAGLDPVERDLDDAEFLTPRSLPVEEALAAARETPTNDATAQGLLLAKQEGLI